MTPDTSKPIPATVQIPAHAVALMRATGYRAWLRGLFAGFNGNMSLRLTHADKEYALVTRTGSAKGRLGEDDLCVVRLDDGAVIAGGKPSSEFAMHRVVYAAQPEAMAVMHTHPPKLLALSVLLPPEERLAMPIHEAKPLAQRLAFAPECTPGTEELAKAVGARARSHQAVWMENHGLMAWGANLADAASLSEELEHLAAIQLTLLQCKKRL